MQMFRRPVQRCAAGDRVGVCVTQLDPKCVERGLACAPGSVPTFSGAIAAVEKIRFFQGACPTCEPQAEGQASAMPPSRIGAGRFIRQSRTVERLVLPLAFDTNGRQRRSTIAT